MPTASHLLINEPPLQVLPSLAVAIGLNEAIILQQLHFRLLASEHIFEGARWYYNTYEEWQKQFPWWHPGSIKRMFVRLEREGLIRSSRFNALEINRTKWYTICYENVDVHYRSTWEPDDPMGGTRRSDERNPAFPCSKTSSQDLLPKTSYKCLSDIISVGAGPKSPKTAPTHRRSEPAREWTGHYVELLDDPAWPLIDHCLTRYYAAYAIRYDRPHPKLNHDQLVRRETILSEAFTRHELDCAEDVNLLVETYWARSFLRRDKKTRATDGNLNAFATVKNLNLLAAQLGSAGVDQDLLPVNGEGGLR